MSTAIKLMKAGKIIGENDIRPEMSNAMNYFVSRDKLWAVLLEYDVRGQLLTAIKLLYKQSEVCVRVNGMETIFFSVSVGLQQGCVLSPLLFILYMEKIDRDSSSSCGVTFGEYNVRRLLFADDLALLNSNKSDLQYAFDWFSDACLDAGIILFYFLFLSLYLSSRLAGKRRRRYT